MDKKRQLLDTVLERAQKPDGRKRLTCAEALEIAQEFEVKPIEIGRICNQHNIRISKCQLGCFA